MWKCETCGYSNADNDAVCTQCGGEKPAEQKDAPVKEEPASAAAPKKTNKKIAVISYAVVITLVLITLAAVLIVKMAVPNKQYKEAIALMEAEDYQGAAEIFEALQDHNDSPRQLEICKEEIQKQNRYQSALQKMESGEYDSAIVIFERLGTYKDSATQLLEAQYRAACAGKELGSYDSAITSFEALGDYKDSMLQLRACVYQTTEVGGLYTFGQYELDGDESNGKESIVWRVLEKRDNKFFVISDCALTTSKYNEEKTDGETSEDEEIGDVTWENCSLRAWLNDTFMQEAFSPAEQGIILETPVKADRNPFYNVDPGNDTVDKLFLLSMTEANTLFSVNERRCFSYSNDSTTWWLRTPGDNAYEASYVLTDGRCDSETVTYYKWVRPAMWINMGE